MFCPYCGNTIDDQAVVCTTCGKPIPSEEPPVEPRNTPQIPAEPLNFSPPPVKPKKDRSGFWFGVLGFFIPIAGLILYLVHHNEQPKKAKSAGIGAIIGYGSSYVLGILFSILYVVFIIFALVLGTVTSDFSEVQHSINGTYYTSDVEVTFGDFEVINNGFFYETYLEVNVENTSDVAWSYFITIEAVDSDGTRIALEELYVESLEAGQEMNAYAFQDIPSYQHFDLEHATYRVLNVETY